MVPNQVTPLEWDLPRQEPHVPEGAPHHGAGAEQLVPADRPQPAPVHGHLHGEALDFVKATQRVYHSACAAVAPRADGAAAAVRRPG